MTTVTRPRRERGTTAVTKTSFILPLAFAESATTTPYDQAAFPEDGEGA